MAKKFPLKILAADGVFFDGEAESLTVPAVDGSLQILAGHENMVLATVEGLVRVRTAEREPLITGVAGVGFTQVSHGEVTVLVDTIERPEDIDRARAERALARAKEQLRQDQSIQEYEISKASLARAMMRLSHANKSTVLPPDV
ncbi:MAG: ATP synthase F1 subunit epsilon [Lachnospiraceae bacterium]|nr:ATP synthase F1 subunit epsilon [Lachnospiraceae bacterium]MCR5476753.1 ATP synthase F1 subunit epsilon [Lachnospiraceae bacterium]